MKEIFGRQGGLCKGKGGSMHIADISKGMLGANGIVGGPPLVCGAALAAKVKKTNAVAVAFFGDGAFNQGTTLEAMNFASVYQLPCSSCSKTTAMQRARRVHGPWRTQPVRRAEGFAFQACASMAMISLPSTGPPRKRWIICALARTALHTHRVHTLLRAFRRRPDDLPATGEVKEERNFLDCLKFMRPGSQAPGWWKRVRSIRSKGNRRTHRYGSKGRKAAAPPDPATC